MLRVGDPASAVPELGCPDFPATTGPPWGAQRCLGSSLRCAYPRCQNSIPLRNASNGQARPSFRRARIVNFTRDPPYAACVCRQPFCLGPHQPLPPSPAQTGGLPFAGGAAHGCLPDSPPRPFGCLGRSVPAPWPEQERCYGQPLPAQPGSPSPKNQVHPEYAVAALRCPTGSRNQRDIQRPPHSGSGSPQTRPPAPRAILRGNDRRRRMCPPRPNAAWVHPRIKKAPCPGGKGD